jgi:hypothetical protein
MADGDMGKYLPLREVNDLWEKIKMHKTKVATIRLPLLLCIIKFI